MESIRSSYVALCKSRIRLLIFGGRCPGGLLTCGPTCSASHMRQNNGRSNTWLSWRRWGRSGFSNEWNDVMVASSLQLNYGKGAALWFDASLLITTLAPWLGCFTPAALHCIPVWHVDPVAWCPTCRWKGLEYLWKRALHSYDGGVHDTTAQWTVACTVYSTIVLLFRTIHRSNPIKQARAGFSRAVDDTSHTFQRQF